jgi:transcriptional regulator with XRE-family HTH domain
MDYDKMIAKRINTLRGKKGLTTSQLALLVGISQAQISRLENGHQGFRSKTLVKIAEALGVKPAFFWIEDEAEADRVAGTVAK